MPMERRQYYVYILTNPNKTLYIGMTNDISRRLSEHKRGDIAGFTSDYGIDTLIYVESFDQVLDAIAREKQLKKWSRNKKLALIARSNPNWEEILPG